MSDPQLSTSSRFSPKSYTLFWFSHVRLWHHSVEDALLMWLRRNLEPCTRTLAESIQNLLTVSSRRSFRKSVSPTFGGNACLICYDEGTLVRCTSQKVNECSRIRSLNFTAKYACMHAWLFACLYLCLCVCMPVRL